MAVIVTHALVACTCRPPAEPSLRPRQMDHTSPTADQCQKNLRRVSPAKPATSRELTQYIMNISILTAKFRPQLPCGPTIFLSYCNPDQSVETATIIRRFCDFV